MSRSLHAKTSSIRPVVSIQHRLVKDGQTDGHTTTAYTDFYISTEMQLDLIIYLFIYLLNTHSVQHMDTNIQWTYKTIKWLN